MKTKVNILIVEDDITNQIILKATLNKLEISTDIANNGLEGLEAYKNNKYNLIIMGIQLPILNGLEASKEIRNIEKKTCVKQIPIIGITANVSIIDLDYFDYGINHLIAKPFKLKILQEIINTWLEEE